MRLILVIFLVTIDQVVKWFYFSDNDGVLNTGGFLGSFSGISWEMVLPILLLYIGFLWLKAKGFNLLILSLLLAGGVSNWWDRIMYGGVRDVIYYRHFHFYGNMADIYLTCAFMLVLIQAVRSYRNGLRKI
jgi:lipoprotein signal peptidase